MTHLEDGTLQAFLDDALAAEDRAAVAEHLLGCERCHANYEELMRANALFAQSISVLDMEPPATRPAGGRLGSRAREGTASLVKAAVLVLVLAAVASAAVPGSPVRAWVASLIEGDQAPTSEQPVTAPAVSERPGAPAGVSINPASGRVVVALSGLDDVLIRLETSAGSQAGISIVGAERDPTFRTGAGRVEVKDGLGGEVRIRLPLGVESARLEVDGALFAETRDGRLELHVTADTADGGIAWR